MKCKICGNESGNKEFLVKEMMMGLRENFSYFQCSKCDCLQIKEIPLNMSSYYPENYYSFKKKNSFIIDMIKRIRAEYAFVKKGFIGKIIYEKFPNEIVKNLSVIKLTKNSRILDVGCGNGDVIRILGLIGFKNILGIDLYIDKPIDLGNGVRILKKSIGEINEKYDVIMLNHSFEHFSDPLETFFSIKRLLSPNGICMIVIPVVDSWAWKNYGINWVQLDAPRHFFLHSLKSMDVLAKKSGLTIKNTVCASTEFQFWGSEQYKKNIPLTSSTSYGIDPSESIFSKEEITSFKKKANEMNSIGMGDERAFYLELGN